jgi:hypothetical protein
MAGSKRRSPTSTLVSKGSIEKAGSALVDLPEKPKEIWSLREAIDALKDQITLALDRGYTYPEISQMLTNRGVEISASTLKYYLSAVKRQDPNSKPRRRRRTLGASLSAEALSLSLVDEAPKKRGRGPGRKKAVEAAAPAEAPKKRGRGPGRKKAVEVAAPAEAPKKRGRKPGAAKAATATATATATKAAKAPKTAKAPKVAKAPKAPKVAKAAAPKAAKAPKVAKAPKAAAATATKAKRGPKPGAKAAKAAAAATATTTKGTRGRKKATA